MPESPKDAGSGGEVTSLLAALAAGDESVRPRIIELLYGELRRLAAEVLREKRRHGLLQRTDLIGEAFLRLNAQQKIPKNSGHFLAIAADVMRRVVVDHARSLERIKRGGGHKHESLDDQTVDRGADPAIIVAMNELVEELERMDNLTARIVVYRYFADYSEQETAEVLGKDIEEVRTRWRVARALLSDRLRHPRS